MKFPLPKNIFPPLELTKHQEQDYEHLASKLIKATLIEYDRFVAQDRKQVNTHRWKTVRARDGITIYRKRHEKGKHQKPVHTPLALYRTTLQTTSSCPSQDACRSVLTSDPISLSNTSSYIPSSPKKGSGLEIIEDSRRTAGYDSYSSDNLLLDPRMSTRADDSSNSSSLPKLLAVGTLRGSLDDVMYGVVSPDAPSVRLRSSYLGEHIADCAVLREIKGPSPAEPFHFLGIKWFVRAKHRGTGRILLPRDFVVLEYSGVMMRPDRSRVGFHLMHSVEISSCRQLSEHRILRAKLSSCYIFEETRNNCVQVFMTASVDPSGYVFTRMAVRSAAIALSNCWKSISCAYDKKLAFCLQNDRPSTIPGIRSSQNRSSSVIRPSHRLSVNEPNMRDTTAVEPLTQRSNYSTSVNCRRCGVCRDKVGWLTKTVSCQLCSEQICHHCRIVRKLSCDTLSSQVTQSSISFCKKCVASVSDESAVEIARQEIWVRAQSRSRASSAIDRRTYRHSFSTERNTYAAVMLGYTSDIVSQESTVTNTIAISSDCLSQNRTPHLENTGCSVYTSASTQFLCPAKWPHSDSVLSKPSSLSTTILSTGSLARRSLMDEALSLSNLCMDKGSLKNKSFLAAEEEKVKEKSRSCLITV